MLIINVDDWGGEKAATDLALTCFKNNRLTSASAFTFMKDSERAAQLALENNIDTGLHLNFTYEFTGRVKNSRLREYQRQIVAFFKSGKYAQLIYNPFLKKQFNYAYSAQYEEYLRLYGKEPTHYNGHHHMHLCTNMLIDRLIPMGACVRRNFSFEKGEKHAFNIFYRQMVDKWLLRYYRATDYFFSIEVDDVIKQVKRIVNAAQAGSVELMVHLDLIEQYNLLMSDEFYNLISGVEKSTFPNINVPIIYRPQIESYILPIASEEPNEKDFVLYFDNPGKK